MFKEKTNRIQMLNKPWRVPLQEVQKQPRQKPQLLLAHQAVIMNLQNMQVVALKVRLPHCF